MRIEDTHLRVDPDSGRGAYSSDPLELILARSRSAARDLFRRFSVPPEVAEQLLDSHLSGLETAQGTLPGGSHRLLEDLEAASRRFRDRGTPRGAAERSDYDAVFDRILAATRARSHRRRREKAQAQKYSAELERELSEGRDPAERSWDSSECSPALAAQLLERCRDSWPVSRTQAERLAKAALTVLSLLEGRSSGLQGQSAGEIQDLMARAWTYIGNIRRIRSQLREAHGAFAAANACLAKGSLHPLERAHALVLESSLRRDQTHYPEAIRLLQQAAAIFRWAGHRHFEGGAYQRMATAQQYAGEAKLAIPLMERALTLLDGDSYPRLMASARQNLAVLLCEVDRFADARRLLPQIERDFSEHGRGEYDSLKVQWLEARILCGEQRTGPAIAILESLRERFLALDRPYDAALASLELVAEYLQQRQPREARELAAQALPVLQSMELERETLAALVALRQATELETATAGWVRGVLDSLRRPRAVGSPSPSPPS